MFAGYNSFSKKKNVNKLRHTSTDLTPILGHSQNCCSLLNVSPTSTALTLWFLLLDCFFLSPVFWVQQSC